MDLLDDLIFEDDEEEQGPSEDELAEASQWNELVSSYEPEEIDDSADEPGGIAKFFARFKKDSNGKPRKSLFSSQQTIILGVLVALVIIVYAAMSTVVLRSYRQQASPGENTGKSIDIVADKSVTSTPSPTPTPEPTATPIPTATLPPAEQVATSYDLQLQRDPSNAPLYIERGHEYLELGAYTAAFKDFTRAIELGEDNLQSELGLGVAAYHLMRWDVAVQAFKETLDYDHTTMEAYRVLGKIYYYQGDYQRAANAWDEIAEMDREDLEAEAWLAICSGNAGKVEETAGAATRAISRTEEIALVYIAQSWAKRLQEPVDLDGAHGDLLYAKGLEPNNFFTLNELTLFYLEYRPERIVEAEQFASWSINWAPDTAAEAVGHQTLGRVYLAQNRPEDALKEFQSAAALATREDGTILIAGLEEDLAKVSP